MNNKILAFASTLIVLAAFSRLLPHPPNFTPIIALSLFGGAYFSKKSWSIMVPVLAMLLSDLALQTAFWLNLREFPGFHSSMWTVYASIAFIALLGTQLNNKISIPKVGSFALLSSILFFIFTNFSVWLFGGFYPQNTAGLAACFTAAIPFFGNTLTSTLAYSAVLFGSVEWLKNRTSSKALAQ